MTRAEAIRALVDAAPPLTDEQRTELAVLLEPARLPARRAGRGRAA